MLFARNEWQAAFILNKRTPPPTLLPNRDEHFKIVENPMNDQQKHLEEYCKAVYTRTRALWQGPEGRYPTWKCRFSILYGPLCVTPELMILGSNPGFDPKDLYDEEILTWPSRNEYWTQSWPFAVKLRQIFANAGCEEQLRDAVGANLLFFKSKSLGTHPSGLGWADNPPDIRKELEDFSRRELLGLIKAIDPKTLLVLGLGTFDTIVNESCRAECSTSDTRSKRRIFTVGQGFGRRVIGMIHPTGARVSSEDLALVSQCLATEIGGNPAIPAGLAASNTESEEKEAQARLAGTTAAKMPVSRPNISAATTRQPPLRPDTLVGAKNRPPGNFGYQPIIDFWHQLKEIGPVSVKGFHEHMLSIGWKRPSGKPLTYEVTRTDLASMCKHGFAERIQG